MLIDADLCWCQLLDILFGLFTSPMLTLTLCPLPFARSSLSPKEETCLVTVYSQQSWSKQYKLLSLSRHGKCNKNTSIDADWYWLVLVDADYADWFSSTLICWLILTPEIDTVENTTHVRAHLCLFYFCFKAQSNCCKSKCHLKLLTASLAGRLEQFWIVTIRAVFSKLKI